MEPRVHRGLLTFKPNGRWGKLSTEIGVPGVQHEGPSGHNDLQSTLLRCTCIPSRPSQRDAVHNGPFRKPCFPYAYAFRTPQPSARQRIVTLHFPSARSIHIYFRERSFRTSSTRRRRAAGCGLLSISSLRDVADVAHIQCVSRLIKRLEEPRHCIHSRDKP